MNQTKVNQISIILLTVAMIFITLPAFLHGQPAATDAFPLTFERNDYPPATPVVNTPTAFQTAGNAKNRFVIVYRNGLLQRPCGTGPCDYVQTGNVTMTFPASGPSAILTGDLVTVFFYR